MAWILVEGLDRSGKSSIAEKYRKEGYTIVHMEAPSKKYYAEGYSGESYFEELVRMYGKYDGKNVLFDRTAYGELIWPQVYGRNTLLQPEDLDYLGELERNNSAEKILMYDSNTEGHWQRCVDNNEPLTRQQFGRASVFYDRLVREYGFKKKQLTDYDEFSGVADKATKVQPTLPVTPDIGEVKLNSHQSLPSNSGRSVAADGASLDDKIELANAIKDVMQNKILKKKGGAYDMLENQIKDFLKEKLEEVFTGKQDNTFSDDEITLLKALAKRVREKA